MTKVVLAGKASAVLQNFEKICAAISAAKTIDDVLEIHDRAAAIEFHMRKRDYATAAHADAWEIMQRALCKLGELCSELPQGKSGRPKKIDVGPAQISKGDLLREQGIKPKEASEWERIYRLPKEDFERDIELGREKVVKTGRAPSVLNVSAKSGYDSDSCGTPEEIAAAGREVLGGEFDLDPCSNDAAQKVIRAAVYWTKADDCRKQKAWKAKRLFLNPPYSRVIKEIILRLLAEIKAGNVKSGLVLVNNQTDATWFQAMMKIFPVWFSEDRIAFLIDGVPHDETRQGQAVFYIGDDLKKFKRVFEGKFGGKVMVAA